MKLLTTILFLTLSLVQTSCGNDDTSSNNNSDNFLIVKIEGDEFKASFVNGLIVVRNNITISGSDVSGNNVVLNFPLNSATGDTFTIDNGFMASFDHSNGDAAVSSQGSVTITSHNKDTKRISGTFSFVGSPLEADGLTYNFTSGTFETAYNLIN
ncbi:DUF6252 family protein [Winogradskyella forsetii]|uniref:DUF6252 family protein n=1 Tax=Winogradskyella forsetii TaxID=2686077 RepID=UPI0015BD623A|nr:DUF6252 family protein [Winogradskyella forsetii]